MADEQYRRFHSGRFGPEGQINPDFATKVQSGGGFVNPVEKKDPEKKDLEEPESMKEFKKYMNARTKAPYGTSEGE